MSNAGPKGDPVVVIGMGRMGKAIASRLIETGHDVAVWNRTTKNVDDLNLRDRMKPTIDDAVAGRSIAITCLYDDEALLDVALGPNGLVGTLDPAALVVDMGTIHPDTARRLSADLGSDRFVCAPVLANPYVTQAGEASILLGGEAETLAALGWLWSAISADQWHCDDAAAACVHKLISNHLLIGGIALLAETTQLGLDAGLTTDHLDRYLHNVATVPPALHSRISRMLAGDHNGWFSAAGALKDLTHSRSLSPGCTLAVTATVRGQLEEVVRRNLGHADMTVLRELLAN